ncbi:MAG: M28 family peptidase [Actinomycetota bacterium]
MANTKARSARVRLLVPVVMVLALAGSVLIVPSAPAAVGVDSTALRNAVTLAGIREHQQEFQNIANANGGTRLAGTSGYDQSADYVFDRLVAAGYSPVRQVFDFAFFQELSPSQMEQTAPTPTPYVNGTDFLTMDYSAAGDVTAPVTAVDVVLALPRDPVTSGCDGDFAEVGAGGFGNIVADPTGPDDFASFPAGNIALMQRGTCTFALKVKNAEAAGASAAIIFNQGNTPGREPLFGGTLGGPAGIPALSVSFALGDTFATTSGLELHIVTDTVSEIRPTENIIAETATGRTDRVVVVGAHLDSVQAGPGINDNGSGSATILEIAEQFSKLGIEPRNQVRFAWWGAEEEGLLGSQFYVDQLSKRDIKNIAVNLNFDMLGSPNFVRFVYDGNGSDTPLKGPTGSANVEKVFLDYFASQGLKTAPTAFDGRSDYGPFIAVGIPAGGLFSGAEGLKTAAQVVDYGGIMGEQYDPCYHEACDTFEGTGDGPGATPPGRGLISLDQLSDGAADAVLQFAMTMSAVPGTDKSSDKAAAAAASLEYWARLRK